VPAAAAVVASAGARVRAGAGTGVATAAVATVPSGVPGGARAGSGSRVRSTSGAGASSSDGALHSSTSAGAASAARTKAIAAAAASSKRRAVAATGEAATEDGANRRVGASSAAASAAADFGAVDSPSAAPVRPASAAAPPFTSTDTTATPTMRSPRTLGAPVAEGVVGTAAAAAPAAAAAVATAAAAAASSSTASAPRFTATERLALRRAAELRAVRPVDQGRAPRLGTDGNAPVQDGRGGRASSAAASHMSLVQQTVNAAVGTVGEAWRTIVREEISKEVVKLADPNGPLLLSFKKSMEDAHAAHAARAAPSERPWSEREKKVIRPEVESVFDSSFVRPIAAVAIAAMVMKLFSMAEARGDVLTPFFPPVKKASGERSFAIKYFNELLESVFKRAMTLLRARTMPPSVIQGLTGASTSKNKVTVNILAVLRVIVNDGRCQARAFWWRTVGYFIFHPSPLVSIILVKPSAPRPGLESADGSPYFAFKSAHLASPSGRISVPQHVPMSIHVLTSDALAKSSSRSAPPAPAQGTTGALTLANAAAAGTSSTLGTGAGSTAVSAVAVPGEVQVQATGCFFRVASALLHALSGRDCYKFPSSVIFAVAVCLRKMVLEPRAHWTTDDGIAALGSDERNLPGRWYLLMPTMTKRAVEDVLLQTLKVEQQDTVDHSATAALSAAMAVLAEQQDAELEEEDPFDQIPLHLPEEPPQEHAADNVQDGL